MDLESERSPARRELDAVFSHALLVLWELDKSGQVVRASPSVAEHLGADPEAWLGDPRPRVHPEDRDSWDAAVAAEGVRSVEVRLQHARGDHVGFRARLVQVGDAPAHTLAILRPHALEQGDLFRTLAENVPGTVYLCRNDATWSMIFLSDDVESLTGYPVEAFLCGEIDFVRLYHPDDAPGIGPLVADALAAKRRFFLSYRLQHRDGSWRHVDEHGQGVWDASGELVFLEGTVIDVTERVQAAEARGALEARLVQAQKLESLGLLAGGIAHDFNNLLAAILGNIELAAQEQAPGSEAARLLEEAVRATETAGRLTRQMLTYAGQSPTEVRRIDIVALVADTLGLVEASVPKKVRVVLERPPEAIPVQGDPAQLQQIVMNTLLNAAESLGPEGGRVWVRVGLVQLDEGPIPDRVVPAEPVEPGPFVLIEVEDEGCGMAPETRARMFDPFFTTKKAGHGLGLAAVIGAVRGHHGALAVASAPGRGTTFRVYLPAERTSPRDDRPAILVVDDEAGLRRIVRAALERAGFEVIEAEDGREGLARLGQRPVAAVILDVNMPEFDGRQFLGELAARGLTVPVLVASGMRTEVLDLQHAGPLGFLAKPYRTSHLVEAVRRLVG